MRTQRFDGSIRRNSKGKSQVSRKGCLRLFPRVSRELAALIEGGTREKRKKKLKERKLHLPKHQSKDTMYFSLGKTFRDSDLFSILKRGKLHVLRHRS